jgi:pyruvate/2-oxoglutarate dehydrogenase complex dihydrolipoamide dehydrogenase (E3) component
MEVFDVVILGAGSAAAAAVAPLRAAGLTVAVVSAGRVGGECSYVACIPSKAMLHSARVNTLIQTAERAGGRVDRETSGDDDVAAYRRAVERRDRLSHHRDDTEAVQRLDELGATLIRGRGRIIKPGVVQVGDEQYGYRDLVINTGSQPTIPPIEGLENADYWTSDVALSSVERPASLVIIGGSAVACELAQMYARFGSAVTVVERAQHLLPKEDFSVAAVLGEVLQCDGIALILDATVARVEGKGDRCKVQLKDGTILPPARLLLATGRHPVVADLGLEALGLRPDSKGIQVDNHCRVEGQEHVWAAGDVTGIAPFTHTANYQGQLIVDNLLNPLDVQRTSDYRAIPRVIYTDPSVASVGMTAVQARELGIDAVSDAFDLTTLSRARVDDLRQGRLVLVADRRHRVLCGASVIAPQAESLIGVAVLAIQAHISLGVLNQVIAPFPSWGEAYAPVVRSLLNRCERDA